MELAAYLGRTPGAVALMAEKMGVLSGRFLTEDE